MSLAALNLLMFAGEVLAASILLPLMAWCVNLFFRERAAMRHLVWLSVFGALLLLPLLALLVPPQVILHQAAPMAMAYDPVPVTMADAAAASFWTPTHIMMALAVLWAAGVLWNLLRLAVGFHGLHRLRRISAPFNAGLDCEVRLAETVPLTFGLLKPVILLPLDAPSWPRERLDAVLGHEHAHVRRQDNLSNGLALLACAFYWPNPFLWLAQTAMCRDAEIAADSCVLAGGMKPSLYAAELLELTAEYHGRAPFAALAMASPSSLEVRVTSILSPTSSRKGVTAMDALRFAGLGSAAALMLAFARPGIAEAQSSAPLQVAPFAPAMPDMPEPPPPPGPPPAPPARPVMAVPPVPPTPPAPLHTGHIWPDVRLTEAQKAKIEDTVSRAMAEMQKSRDPMQRDLEAEASEAADRAVRESLPVILQGVSRALAQTNSVISDPEAGNGNRSVREAGLIAKRNAREALLKRNAAQRQIVLDAKFAQLKAEREMALGIRMAERTARLALQKAARAAHTLR